MVVANGWEGESEESVLNGDRISVGEDEQDYVDCGGDSCLIT